MSDEPSVAIPAEEPRYCPACKTRVATRATTCLICGASLDAAAEPETVEEQSPRRGRRWLFWLGTVTLALVLLLLVAFLVRPLIFPPIVTPTPTPSEPARTPTPTIIPTPTVTPTATPTPTPVPPRAHQVQQGETLLIIAQQYDTTLDEILALNPGINPQLLQTGQVLLIPPALSPGGESPPAEPGAATATPGSFILHVVAPGDTLLSIAERYGITVALIRTANPEIPAGSEVIQVNQTLVIPVGTPTPTLVPTVDANTTPTPLPPYSPPALLSPPDGALFVGPNAVIVLQWASVGILRPGEWYAVHVARPGIAPVVVRTRATAFRVPAELYPPPGFVSREVRWHVQVVRQTGEGGAYERVSLPEPVRTFLWLETTSTPTATPAP